jgi:hypothetical protein
MNNLAVFMVWSLLATLVLSSNSLDNLDSSNTIEGSISDNNAIVSEENNSNGVLDESHSVNSSLMDAKPTKASKKPPSLDFSLTGSKAVSPGSQITYTIKYKNNLKRDIDLVITEDYGPGTVFMKSDPEPDSGTDNTWTIKGLHPSSKWIKIKITVKVPKSTCEAEIEGSVSGIGYSSVHGTLSTNRPSYKITNQVTLSYEAIKKTLLITTTIKPVDGANIDFSEHGSGDYSSNEMLSLSSSRLSADQNLRAKGTFALVNISSHPLSYNSSWYANRVCENHITKATLREKYLHANALDLDSSAEVHKKETWMETESNFTGIAEFASKGKNIAVDEMFIGMFKTRNKEIERYNSSSKHLSKDWLEGCDDNPNNQMVDENVTENDTGNETDQEVVSSNEIIDPETTY